MATVVRANGSTPQSPGARLLLRPDGSTVGTVGGGAFEKAVVEVLHQCLRDGRPRIFKQDLLRDLGMCCGGSMEVFVEPVQAQSRLILFGAGHVARPTALFARELGFQVVVVDDRPELNTEERFPECTRIVAEPGEAADSLETDDNDWIVVVTHDHRLDEEALDAFARRPHAYLGVIGSRRKVYRMFQRIHARRGLPSLERVYAPIGLNIGAVSPEEIAISIIGQLVALRHGKGNGSHLRVVDDPSLQRVLRGEVSPEAASDKP